jgi:antitoxin MazE
MNDNLTAEDGSYNVITQEILPVKTRLIAIGNSRGVRLPKPLIEEAGLEDEVEIHARKGEIVIRPVRKLRSGWAEAAKLAHDRKEDVLVDQETSTHFDETEWEW